MARPAIQARAVSPTCPAVDSWERPCVLAAAALALALAPLLVLAQSGSASYQIPRQSIDGGANRSTSASYSVEASLGQPDAGPPMMSASFILNGGFQRGSSSASQPDQIFRDGFESP